MPEAFLESERLASTLALQRLLDSIAASPRTPTALAVRAHLRSQGDLAAYASTEHGISACSLNTLKRSCAALPGGFAALDAARKRAIAAVDESHAAASQHEGSKRQIQKRNVALKEKLADATEDLMLLTRVLEKAMHQGRLYATDSRDSALIARCAREQATLRDMLTLRRSTPGLKVVGGDQHEPVA